MPSAPTRTSPGISTVLPSLRRKGAITPPDVCVKLTNPCPSRIVSEPALTNGRQHDAMQHAAMDGVLRKFVPGIAAAEFGNDVLAELVDVAKFPRLDADRLDRIDDIELRQFTNRMWQDVDPHTQRFQLLGDIEGDELDAAPL